MVFGFFHKDSAGRSLEQNSVADYIIVTVFRTMQKIESYV